MARSQVSGLSAHVPVGHRERAGVGLHRGDLGIGGELYLLLSAVAIRRRHELTYARIAGSRCMPGNRDSRAGENRVISGSTRRSPAAGAAPRSSRV